MLKGVEGFLIPKNLGSVLESMRLSSTQSCMLLQIEPLVTTKIKAYHDREAFKDYQDLHFACTASFASLVRGAADKFNMEWKLKFLSKVIEKNPGSEKQVRWALNLEPEPSSKDKKFSSEGNGRGAGNGSGAGGSSGGKHPGVGSGSGAGGSSGEKHRGGSNSGARGSSSHNSPRDGDKSKDGYWTFSEQHNRWYHRSSNGAVQWAQ